MSQAELARIWAALDGPSAALSTVELTGTDPVLASEFDVGALATASVAAVTLAAAQLWQLRCGQAHPPTVRVDGRHAAAAFASERHLRIAGRPMADGAVLTGDYRTADGWVRLHANYPAHATAACRALEPPTPPDPEPPAARPGETPISKASSTTAGARPTRSRPGSVGPRPDGRGELGPDDRDVLRAAVRGWTAEAAQEAVVAEGGAAAALRSSRAWAAHPQGRAVAAQPLVTLTRIGPAEPVPLGPAQRPLTGIRVLDLTRVIAGPVAGRALAAHGAEVLRVGADHLALVPDLVVDTGFGKRFTHLDLRTPAGVARLADLVAGADVVLQAFRPGTLAARGFGPAANADRRPGVVHVDVSAWGSRGPWAGRRGFDSLVQLATGLADDARIAAGDPTGAPRPLPVQALDHATGYLAAAAVVRALTRRAVEGGSWYVGVSLAGTAAELASRPRIPAGLSIVDTGPGPELSTVDTPFGLVDHVPAAGWIDGAAPYWATPPHRPGADEPRWLTLR